MSEQEGTSKKTKIILYFFSFILLWEWIRPLEQLTDTGYTSFFLIFISISLAFSFFQVNTKIAVIVKCLFIIYSLNYFYYDDSFIAVFGAVFQELKVNFKIMYLGSWEQLTNPFRSILFYSLLWIMTYLIRYWLLKQQKIFMFFFTTLIYITVLDTFTEYDAKWAIVRVTVVGFSLLSMLTLLRMHEDDQQLLSRNWFRLLAMMIVISLISGFVGPKLAPQWPDPVPFLQSAAKKDQKEQGKRVGYSWDDSELGGPVIGNDELVFTAEVDKPHYWKIETKDYYTGKGWELITPSEAGMRVAPSDPIPILGYSHGVTLTKQQSVVEMAQQFPHIQYPYGVKYIDTNIMGSGVALSFSVNETTGKIVPIFEGRQVAVEQYTITYDHTAFKIEVLREQTDEHTEYLSRKNLYETEETEITDEASRALIQATIDYYTQLPESLPERTIQLAKEITEGKENWFDQAQAIETYFSSSGFTYDLKNVASPGDNDDYVDQFLFDTKQGYCDNFSTSMVVLLRANGIPARWTKGYTEGDYIGATPTGKKIYEVTNNHAHSWVEVLFPNVGWVPFEPTKGFSNNTEFITNTQMNEQPDSNEALEREQQEQEQQQRRERPQLEREKPNTVTAETISFKKIKQAVVDNWKVILLIGALLSILVLTIFKTRGKWLPTYYLIKFKNIKDASSLEKAMNLLLKQFARKGLVKEDGQTLRDFADTADHLLSTDEMTRFNARYEKYMYRGILTNDDLLELRKLWESLIIKART